MHCHGCGRINRMDTIFCDGCGTRLTTPSTTLGSSPMAEPVPVGREEGHHHPGRSRVPERLREGVFVGRQREMEGLRADLEAALSGRGRYRQDAYRPGVEHPGRASRCTSALGALL
jgi:hypothetical protein